MYVIAFPNIADSPDKSYRQWLAPLQISLVQRSRFLGKHLLEWFDVIDPDDGVVMGVVRETRGRIIAKLSVRTIGKPRTLRDTFDCAGKLSDPGPWELQKVAPCRSGCEFCEAPESLTIARG